MDGCVEHGLMAQPWRRSLGARIGAVSALLAVALVCPLMAAGAVPATPSCHGHSDDDSHDERSAAIACCAVVKGVKSLPSAQQPVALAPAAVDAGPHAVPHVDRHHDRAAPGFPAPPLFLQHAALLI